jgi:hypothetical protein
MSGGITPEMAVDLGYSVLRNYDENEIQHTFNKNTFEFVNRKLNGAKVITGGKGFQFDIVLKDQANGKWILDYEPDDPNVANLVQEGTVNWANYQNSFSYSLLELNECSGKNKIFDVLDTRRKRTIVESAEELENVFWRTPNSAQDKRRPHGLPAWLCQADADTSDGWTGYVGDYWSDTETAYSTVGGLACTSAVNARWANRYYDHNGLYDYSLLKKLSEMLMVTKFQTPKLAGQSVDTGSEFNNFQLYTNKAVILALEDLAIKADDNVGSDLGKYAGAVTFKNMPFIYVDNLDTAKAYVYGSNPIFGVNWNMLNVRLLAGENFRWGKPMNDVRQPNVWTCYFNITLTMYSPNRRHLGFLMSNWESST